MEYVERYRNSIFLVVIGLTIILLVSGHFLGKAQNNQSLTDQASFKEAVKFVSSEKPDQGRDILSQLHQEYNSNDYVTWQYGWSLAVTGGSGDAIPLFIQAQEINPVLSRKKIFLLQFGIALFENKQYEEAKLYLEESKNYSLSDDHITLVNNLLEEIEQQLEL